MREIRFRAWYKREQRMYEVSTIRFGVQHGMAPSDRVNYVELDDKDRLYIDGEDIELLQYTGLIDKTGREIYEGDIVRWDAFPPGTVYTRVVQWSDDQAMFLPNDMNNDVEIIGNIYENQDLLPQEA